MLRHAKMLTHRVIRNKNKNIIIQALEKYHPHMIPVIDEGPEYRDAAGGYYAYKIKWIVDEPEEEEEIVPWQQFLMITPADEWLDSDTKHSLFQVSSKDTHKAAEIQAAKLRAELFK